MIIELIVLAFFHLISAVIDAIPVLPVLTFISDSLQFVQWIAWANYYLPLEDFVTGTLAVIGCWVVSCIIRIVIDLL